MRPALILLLLALAGCNTTGTPAPSNCSFWDNVPYNSSQTLWREFDCPDSASPNRK
ncbi:hypothetical protein NKK48_01380 [Mesorhizobium sp. C386A]|uniref:hypothetical protein n=1 Tax=unclassified Mesorhizobium TaxID=325217 RepID=UPI0003CEF036|nr:hypothetical protein [Mesorhizobium sp. LNJC386A00]ESY35733.1 hypothetical protein X748_14055 [Mesorhizobium sp. LNJC386A00]